MNWFGLSISQFTLTGLQHLVGILVLRYERGMTLNADYFEALLTPVGAPKSGMCRLAPRKNMAIIKGFALNSHLFWKHYFFVRIDSASVEESCIPFFQSRWGRKETNILPSFPENLPTVRDILRGGPYFRSHFSLECVHRAVAYNRSRLQPDLPVEEESKSDMEEFVPYDILGEKERSRSPKNKQIAVDSCDSGAINRLECPTDEMFCNFLNSQASGSGTDQTDM
ncbi:hypothetical protein F2Q69_00059201 [Brassica cretica]|uniref:Uncharacterized protein n=1 Tax=Brassica cretica TaxID=69181 RepID=A0A8S9RG53_BRACR|nr:hypothetical protein F2Q69_00059201 [Brassica cretica]